MKSLLVGTGESGESARVSPSLELQTFDQDAVSTVFGRQRRDGPPLDHVLLLLGRVQRQQGAL